MYGGIGMLASAYLGSWMAPRRKMPFVFVPGMLCRTQCAVAMALAMGDAFWFLTLFGVGAMLEIVTRPAITAILRLNYPVAQRGHVTATVRSGRRCLRGVELALGLCLCSAPATAKAVAQTQIPWPPCWDWPVSFASGNSGPRRPRRAPPDFQLNSRNVRDAVGVVVRDARYRRYLFGCFLEASSACCTFR